MTALEFYTSGFSWMLYLIIIIFIAMFYLRYTWQKEAKKYILVEVVQLIGRGYTTLIEEDNGIIELPPRKKSKKGGKRWTINSLSTYEVEYPGSWVPSFLRTTIRKTVVQEWNWEPFTNRSPNPVATPNLEYNLEWEKFTKLAVAYSEVVHDLEEKLQKALAQNIKPIRFYILMGLAIVAGGYSAYLSMEMTEILKSIQSGLGL